MMRLAFPIITSEADKVMKTIDPEQPLEEQEPIRLTPLSIMIADTIGALCLRVLLKVLFDSGSTVTFISQKVLPRECKPFPIKQGKKVNTIAGMNLCNEMVVLQDICLPELDKNQQVHQQKVLVFNHNTRYDVILERTS